MGYGAKPRPKMSLSHHHETHWSRIKRRIVRNFQILIVSVLSKSLNNVCKLLQLLRLRLYPQTATGASPLGPAGPLGLLGYSPAPQKMKTSSTATGYMKFLV